MDGFRLAGICVLASTMALSGCVARTYNLTRDRVDQDLSSASGNRGYLTGQAPEPKERATTRTVRVFEIELGKTKKSNVSCPATTPLGTNIEESTAGLQETLSEPAQGFEKYSVAKNDTLQKISKKFYGTTKKWMKIYNANKNVLSAPDKLYPGQTLNIPSAPASKTGTEKTAEIKENLK
ncbi:MAG: LysM peptidoglycan-binding domain-containing protein [Candidatus Omnitrophica bacterium]|nr:LysM peptidoglycan-binding domain-containing protein [Candidatus Omnitrophota bacterium]